MLIANQKIAIVGGGPGGLTLAGLLQMQGADVTVYERDRNKEVRVQGATLDLHQESGLAALEAAGLMDAFKAHYRPGAEKLRVMDQHAVIAYDEHTEVSTEDAFGGKFFRPEIDRGPLRNILLDALQPDTVVWNSHIVSLTPAGNAWQLVFQNGHTATADVVIGADGANSKVRPFLTPITPFYAGVTVVEGTIYDAAANAPHMHALVQGGKIFAMGDSQTLILSAKGDGSLSFYTGMKTNESWVRDSGIDFTNHTQVLAWFQREFAAWDSAWYELFENPNTHFIPRPQYCMPLDQTWEAQPNITLLGDAAHLMPPYAGEGVNMAMLDALELSRHLTGNDHPHLHAAIAAYEIQMRSRASEVAGITLHQTEMLHTPDAIEYLIRLFTAFPD